MRQYLLGGMILLLALLGAGYMAWPDKPVDVQAKAAYAAGDYAAALPLLKKWAGKCQEKRDTEQLKSVMKMIVTAEIKLNPALAAGTPTTSSSPGTAPATGPGTFAAGSPQDVNARIQKLLTAQGAGDPQMGASRVPHTKIADNEVPQWTVKEMANFNFDPEKDSTVPADIKLLDGAHLKLRGFMIPINQAEQITDFALVPSLVSCCFGQPPGVQHTITCRTPKGKAIPFTIDELVVEGTLHVNVKKDEGYTYSIFDLDVISVKLAG